MTEHSYVKRSQFEWPDEIVDRLKKLWSEGLSASIIAMRLGNGLTRNSVIGKAYRLELPSRTTTSALQGSRNGRLRHKAQVRRLKAPQPKRLPSYTLRDSLGNPMPPTPLPPRAETDIARVSFNDLETGKHCKWVCGDPADSFKLDKPLYCGQPPVLGLPYCVHHGVRAHSPPELKMRISIPAHIKQREFA